MSKLYEYIIKLNDRSSRPLQDIASNAAKARGAVDEDTRSVDKLGESLDKITTAAKRAFVAFVSFESVKGISKLGQDMEQTQIAFEVMLQSTDKAKKMLSDLLDFSKRTPFQFTNLTEASKLLLTFGENSNKVMKDIKLLGDVSMGNNEKFQSLAYAFGEIVASGQLMGRQRMMMTVAGFNPLQELSRTTGKTVIEMKKLEEEGKISSDMVRKALVTATSEGGRFYNALLRQSETMAGRISTLKDKIQQIGIKMGQGINKGLGAWVDLASKLADNEKLANALIKIFTAMGNKLQQLAAWVEKNADFFKRLADVIFTIVKWAWNTIADLVGGLIDRLRDLYAWIERNHEIFYKIGRTVLIVTGFLLTYRAALLSITIATRIWATVTTIANTVVSLFTKGFGILNIVMASNPLALIIMGIVALVGVIIYCYNHFDKFRATLWGLWSAAKTVFENILNAAKQTFVPLAELIEAVKEGRWLDAAKAGGKLLLNVSMLPGKLALDAITGKLTKGVADSYKEGYNKGLKDKGLQLPEWAHGLINKFTGKGGSEINSALSPSAANGLSPDKETQSGIDNISSGGKSIRNVNVRVDNIWKGDFVVNNKDAGSILHDLQTQIQEVLVRAVTGSEQVLGYE